MKLRLASLLLTLAAACSQSATPNPQPPDVSGSPQDPAQDAGSGAAGERCGGIAGFRCPSGSYCSFPPEARCGAADQMGTCEPMPDVCTEEYAPVCGCDDKTYGNRCAAARAGVSVSQEGECSAAQQPSAAPQPNPTAAIPEGGLCGTRGVEGECAEGLYCAYVRDCGADDSGGKCTPRPQACNRMYAPVCGCDGRTHPNACVANSNGTSVAEQGECPKG